MHPQSAIQQQNACPGPSITTASTSSQMTSTTSPSNAPQGNHGHRFVLLDKSEVPEEWKQAVSDEYKQAVADRLGTLPENVISHICHEVPDTSLGRLRRGSAAEKTGSSPVAPRAAGSGCCVASRARCHVWFTCTSRRRSRQLPKAARIPLGPRCCPWAG